MLLTCQCEPSRRILVLINGSACLQGKGPFHSHSLFICSQQMGGPPGAPTSPAFWFQGLLSLSVSMFLDKDV